MAITTENHNLPNAELGSPVPTYTKNCTHGTLQKKGRKTVRAREDLGVGWRIGFPGDVRGDTYRASPTGLLSMS